MIRVGTIGNKRYLTDEEIKDLHTRACLYASEYEMSVPEIKERLQITEAAFRGIVKEGKQLTGIEFKAAARRPTRPHGYNIGRRSSCKKVFNA